MNESFVARVNALGIELNARQLEQFEIYYNELIAWNNKLNLTSITEREEVYLKHFYDSLCLIKAIPLSNQTMLDVGSGAGFPSIPLKIIYPNLSITIVDATQKRIHFLNHLCNKLQIDAVLIHGRIEEYHEREGYQIVTARAVANLCMLCELCIPYVAIEGWFLAMKGPHHQEELDDSAHAINVLNATLDTVVTYRVGAFDRAIVRIQKLQPSPVKYPRRYKKIKSKPL